MNTTETKCTICDSKEESIQKALEIYIGTDTVSKPITRPNISLGKVLFSFCLWLIFCLGSILLIRFIGNYFNIPTIILIGASAILLVCVICFKIKAFIVNSVLLYQKYAPEKLRRSCLFVPSCSEYMLLAIEKYGVIKGFFKGCGRLFRCHHPNGGEDFP